MVRLKLVTDLPEQPFAPGDVLSIFNASRRRAIDYAENSASLFGHGYDDFYRVRCRTEDPAHFGHHFEHVQYVQRVETFAEKNDKAVACTDGLRVLLRQVNHGRIGTAPTDKAFTRRLAKRQPELYPRHRRDQCLMDILDRLDEMALTKDEISRPRFFDPDSNK
jgi:hypothetical protein